ncbi:MAG TPA: sigma-70 family RNA polymerase sigma factor [Candidatus Nitrosopolaris sp.]|nr:sigma-70 family RNA polymerase sigma factor [Candidatus Nitrosopolaris sp.]
MTDDAREGDDTGKLRRLLERLAADQARAAEGNRDRDEAAWSELYGVLHRMSRSVPGDQDEREDVVQAVCVKLHKPGMLTQVLNARLPGPYLMSTLRNAFFDMLRPKRREIIISGPRSEQWMTALTAAVREEGEPAVLPVYDERQLQSTLNELPSEKRELFSARYLERRSLEAIAAERGISKQAVIARLHRIKKSLQSSTRRRGNVTATKPTSGKKVRVERLRAVWAAWNTEGHPWHPLAKSAGISHATVSRILTPGRTKTVRPTTLEKLAKALRVPAEWLTGERADLPHVPEWDYSDSTRQGPSRWEKPTARDVQWSWLLQRVEDAIKRDLQERYGSDARNVYDAWGHRVMDVIAHLCDLNLWRRATLFTDYGKGKDELFVLRWLEHLLAPWLEGKAYLKAELLGEVYKALLAEDAGFEFLEEDKQAEMLDAALAALRRHEQGYYDSLGPEPE